ncbi:MAG: hypothetical protein ABR985_08595 [Methanotrichaceae archaeon]|jgi:hypothetical protein
MVSEHRVSILKPGTVFRDWLLDVIGERIQNKDCNVVVYKIRDGAHTVCRYRFKGEGYSVVAKFYADSTMKNRTRIAVGGFSVKKVVD